MAYTARTWINNGGIPLNAENLNTMEKGIEEAVNRVNIGDFYVDGETDVKLGYKPKYLTAIANDGTESFSMFQNTAIGGLCSFTDEGFVVHGGGEITNANLSNYFMAERKTYCFVYNASTYKCVCNNKNKDNTTAKTKLTAKFNMEIEFEYGCSSESSCDEFSIYIYNSNNEIRRTIVNKLSGLNIGRTYKGSIGKGESIVFQYNKDGTKSTNDDMAYFTNIIGTTLKSGQWSYMTIK